MGCPMVNKLLSLSVDEGHADTHVSDNVTSEWAAMNEVILSLKTVENRLVLSSKMPFQCRIDDEIVIRYSFSLINL